MEKYAGEWLFMLEVYYKDAFKHCLSAASNDLPDSTFHTNFVLLLLYCPYYLALMLYFIRQRIKK